MPCFSLKRTIVITAPPGTNARLPNAAATLRFPTFAPGETGWRFGLTWQHIAGSVRQMMLEVTRRLRHPSV